jgi:ribonuclease HI
MSKQHGLIAYADGSCLGNPGPGGWGIVLVNNDGSRQEFCGAAPSTTNNRMEITAAIEALRRSPPGIEVTIRTDSQYLVKTMTLGWKRRENLDLWQILDAEVARRKVTWEWVRGHAGEVLNERADELARNAALGKPQGSPLDGTTQINSTATGEPHLQAQGCNARHSSPKKSSTRQASAVSKEEAAENDHEAEVVRMLRPLLATDEQVRRCAGCRRAFVAIGNPPRLQAYCSLAACQLKRRKIASR